MSEDDIRRIVAGAVPYRSGPSASLRASDATLKASPASPPKPIIRLRRGSTVQPEAVRWLWRDWLALGKLHLLAGSAGTGKTTIALSLAASVTTGGGWPDGSAPTGAGDVLIWSGEDGVADTLLPRFLASGGDAERIHFVEAASDPARGERPFDPASDMPGLMEAVQDLPDLRLLILDPVVSAITGDSHKNSETRRGLQPVVDFALKLDCAALGITHLAKNSGGRDPLDRVAGSLAFGAVPRLVMTTVKPSDPKAPRRLLRAKSNNGPDTDGFEYTLRQAPVPGHAFTAQRTDWGQPLDGSARELMAVETPDDGPSAVDEAEVFLLEALKEGPMATKAIRDAAEAHGHNWRSVERAKKILGVKAIKLDFLKGWSWQLPASNTANTGEDRQPTELWRSSEKDR